MTRLTIGVISFTLSPQLQATLASIAPVPHGCEVLLQLARAERAEADTVVRDARHSLRCDDVHVLEIGDSGIYNAMNRIRSKASGDYLWYLNAGDELHPACDLGDVLGYLAEPTCYGFRSEQCFGRDVYLRPAARENEPPWYRIGHQSTIYHAAAFRHLEFDETLPVSADVAFSKACFDRVGMQYVAEVLSRFELGGLSNRYDVSDFPAYRGEGLGLRARFLAKAALKTIVGPRALYRLLACGKYDHRRSDDRADAEAETE